MDLFSRKEGLTPISEVQVPDEVRHKIATGVEPLDLALGGGFVRGEVVLFGGEPGVGKTTFLLQVLSGMSEGQRCVYNSAEEDVTQLKMAVERVGAKGNFRVGNISEVLELSKVITEYQTQVLVVDSIQGFHLKTCDARVGSPTQLKESCNRLIKLAKEQKVSLVIICQLSKDGTFKGPKDLEHNVDAVAMLTNGTDAKFKVLLFSKNRFGPTNQEKLFRWEKGKYIFTPEAAMPAPVVDVALASGVATAPERFSSQAPLPLTNHDKVVVLATQFRSLTRSIESLCYSIRQVKAKYGPFTLAEEHFPLFSCSQERWKRVLGNLKQELGLEVVSELPLVLQV